MQVRFPPGAPGYSPEQSRRGEMAEWLKAQFSKNCMGVTSSWVQIPLSPPRSLSSTDRAPVSGTVDGRSIRPGSTNYLTSNGNFSANHFPILSACVASGFSISTYFPKVSLILSSTSGLTTSHILPGHSPGTSIPTIFCPHFSSIHHLVIISHLVTRPC